LEFLVSIWAEWKVLLTGGSILAILSLVGLATGKTAPRNVNWAVLGATLILAAFAAWRKEWIQNSRGFIDVKIDEITKSVRGVTDVYARIKRKPFLHKWVRITGTVSAVSPMFPPVPAVYVSVECEKCSVFFFVPFWKAGYFTPLAAGTEITLAGRIVDISSYRLKLASVELLSVAK
jgi:hypothetical protein